jgi:hypothetical protein
LEDFLAYPIWIWALDHEDEYDETWVYPITNTRNVTDDMIDVFILLQDDEGRYYMANYYTDDECIYAIYRYDDFDFLNVSDIEEVKYPIRLKSIPNINGSKMVYFQVIKPNERCYKLMLSN